jgi:hypothetical protein
MVLLSVTTASQNNSRLASRDPYLWVRVRICGA